MTKKCICLGIFDCIYFVKIYTRTKLGAFFAGQWHRNAPPAGGCYILFSSS